MTNLKFIKTLAFGFALVLMSYAHAWAVLWNTKDCADTNGYACYDCGSNCTATLYQDGRLVVSGTGVVNGGDGTNVTFSNSSVKPTSLIIQEGITDVNTNAFFAIGAISSLELPDSLTTIRADGFTFGDPGISKLTVGETNFDIVGGPGTRNIQLASDVMVVCRGNIDLCRTGKGGMFNVSGKNIEFTNELRDENDKLLEKWSANEHLVFDENENIIAKYSKSGDLLQSYIYNDDKSVEIYDANGKLTGLKNAKSITPAQAAALVKKGNNNTVTLTFK